MSKEIVEKNYLNKVRVKKMNGRFTLILTAFVIGLGLTIYFLVPEVQSGLNKAFKVLLSNDKEYIKNWVTTFGWFGPILLILAMIIQMLLMVIPTTVILVVCVLAYGPFWGSVIALVAIYAASTAGYLLGRTFGSVTAGKILENKAKMKSINILEKYGFWAIFITRLNPFLSNDAVSIVGGMVKMDYWKFIAASLLGITPLILCIAIFGESTKGLIGLLIGSGVILIIFLVFELIFKRKIYKSILVGTTVKK